jgi:hypothetical protein
MGAQLMQNGAVGLGCWVATARKSTRTEINQ